FNVRGAWGREREADAAAVFTERGIYRPGETVYAKAIVRDGPLGSLRAPAPGDSIRWIFYDRDGTELHREVVALSEFGTSDRAVALGRGLPLGHYRVEIQRRYGGAGGAATGGGVSNGGAANGGRASNEGGALGGNGAGDRSGAGRGRVSGSAGSAGEWRTV